MPKIKVDGVEYHSEDLMPSGQAQLQSLQFLEMQVQELQQEMAL